MEDEIERWWRCSRWIRCFGDQLHLATVLLSEVLLEDGKAVRGGDGGRGGDKGRRRLPICFGVFRRNARATMFTNNLLVDGLQLQPSTRLSLCLRLCRGSATQRAMNFKSLLTQVSMRLMPRQSLLLDQQ